MTVVAPQFSRSNLFPLKLFSGLSCSFPIVSDKKWLLQVNLGKKPWWMLSRNSMAPMSLMGASRTRNQKNPVKHSFVFTTNDLLNESNGISFDQYMEDTTRIFNALFHDEKSLQLEQDVWRIQMLPVQVLFMTATPVGQMQVRCKTSGEGYPPQVPSDIARILDFSIMKWEFQGLNINLSYLDFSARGVIYPDRRQLQHRLMGHMEMDISYSIPPALSFIPQDLLSNLFKEEIKKLVQYMNRNLLMDYNTYRREMLKN
ncbi:hypothetical protein SAY87_021656 [Trapa incisa]|uniref:Uncharacterized protein n=1 Tax=Trapa incisa TaxID=236973 RepID=A0AAN7JXE1_9MYRT|nr:hypothetical protein SAY87_021656 [Trapa incisa]